MTVIQVDVTEIGRKGGLARGRNLSAEELTEIGRKGAAARWADKTKKKKKKKK